MPGASSRWLDLVLSVGIFITVSLACGRIYRFPFDDEVFTLRLIGKAHITNVPRYFLLIDDLSPPFSYFAYYVGLLMGLRVSSLRWISFGNVAVGLAIWHWLTLKLLSASAPLRLLIAISFGLIPLAISQGDALRWYPMLTLAVAVAFSLYLLWPQRWFLSGAAFGLMADISFLAILPLLAVLFHRYVIERKFRWREDLTFLSFSGVLAIPGFITFGNLLIHHDPTKHFTAGVLRRIAETTLGFFGGVVLGVSQALLVVPAIVATIFLIRSTVVATRNSPSAQRFCDPILILAGFAAILTLIGLSEPRGFLFLAPMVTALTSMGLVHAMRMSPRLGAIAYAALLVVSISVAGNLRSSTTPFKRNSVIPYGEVIDFVRSNEHGRTAVLTMDAVSAYSLSAFPELCVAEYEMYRSSWVASACSADQIVTVIVIKGDPLDENDPPWRNRVEEFTRARQPIAQAHFGEDADAKLKSRLAHIELSSSLLDAAIYR